MVDRKQLLEEIFINYNNEVMFIGRHKDDFSILAYVVCIDLNEIDDDFENRLNDIRRNTSFKEYSYTDKNRKLFEPGACGFCFLCHHRLSDLTIKETILVEMEEKKRHLELLTKDNPAFVSAIGQLVQKFPNTYSLDRSYSVELVMEWLSFIDQMDCLLLSDDENLRNIFIKYKTKQTRCWKSKMRRLGSRR